MSKKFFKNTFIFFFSFLAYTTWGESKSILKICVPRHLLGESGSGNIIKELFRKKTGVDIEYIPVPNYGMTEMFLKKNQATLKADLILAVDRLTIEKLKKSFLVSMAISPTLPNDMRTRPQQGIYPIMENFICPMTNDLLNSSAIADDTLEKFLQTTKGFVMQDPRTSQVGINYLQWIFCLGKERALRLLKLTKEKRTGLAPNWSASYKQFYKGKEPCVLSYVGSEAYHQQEGQTHLKACRHFKNTPYLQTVSYVVVLKRGENADTARQFIEFLYEPDIQYILSTQNYSFPICGNVRLKFGNTFVKRPDNIILESHVPTHLFEAEWLVQKWLDLEISSQ